MNFRIYLDDEYSDDEIFNNPPVQHKPWEAEFYKHKFEKLFADQNFLLGCGVAAAVIVLVVIGTIVQYVQKLHLVFQIIYKPRPVVIFFIGTANLAVLKFGI